MNEEELEKKKAEFIERAQAFHQGRMKLVAKSIELPAFQWEGIEQWAGVLSLSVDQLVRVWVDEKLRIDE
jgi:hypothetical protein